MSTFSTLHSLDDKVKYSAPATSNQVSGNVVQEKKKYKKYGNNEVIMEALAFYVVPRGTTLASYCNGNYGRNLRFTVNSVRIRVTSL